MILFCQKNDSMTLVLTFIRCQTWSFPCSQTEPHTHVCNNDVHCTMESYLTWTRWDWLTYPESYNAKDTARSFKASKIWLNRINLLKFMEIQGKKFELNGFHCVQVYMVRVHAVIYSPNFGGYLWDSSSLITQFTDPTYLNICKIRKVLNFHF